MSQHRIDIGPPCCLAVCGVHMAILRVLPGVVVDDLSIGLVEVSMKLRRRAKVMSLTFYVSSSYVQASGMFFAFWMSRSW
jgi:hypothetical protein